MTDNKKFRNAVIFGFILVAGIAIFDISSMVSGVFGTPEEYLFGDYTAGWWGLFQGIVLAAMVFIAFLYFFVVRKDKSEALAIFLVPYILWRFGVSDVLFFWFRGMPIRETLPWLNNHIPISYFAMQGVVTAQSLLLSAIAGIAIALGIAWLLKNKL